MNQVTTLAALTAAVACRLPDGWDHTPDPELPGAVHGPDGMYLILSPSAFAGRVVQAILPVEISITALCPGLRSRCRIRVALAHDPDALASAIEARLLPVYVPLFHSLADRATVDPCHVVSTPGFQRDRSTPSDLELQPLADGLFRVTAVVAGDQIPGLRAALARTPP